MRVIFFSDIDRTHHSVHCANDLRSLDERQDQIAPARLDLKVIGGKSVSILANPSEKYVVSAEGVTLKQLAVADISDRIVGYYEQESGNVLFTASRRVWDREMLESGVSRGLKSQSKFYYGIYLDGQEEAVGTIVIGDIDKLSMTSDMVVLVGDPSCRGKGIATKAIRLGNRAAFGFHGIRKLYGGMLEANVASIKAYMKADWIIEGVRKEHYLVDGKPMDYVCVACFNPDWRATS